MKILKETIGQDGLYDLFCFDIQFPDIVRSMEWTPEKGKYSPQDARAYILQMADEKWLQLEQAQNG